MADSPAAGKDVARPGTTPASATSKPVIVGHTAQVADPMVSSDKKEPEAAPAEVPAGSSRSKLTPSASAEQLQADTTKEEDDKAATAELEVEAKATEESHARLQEMIESGEYNVSIGQASAGSSIRTFLITAFSIVLVGVIVIFILTDLKIIDLGIKLPFHIFKQ